MQFQYTYLVTNCYCRIKKAAVPCNTDLNRNWFGQKMTYPISNLCNHNGKTDNQEKYPNKSAACLPGIVSRCPQSRNVNLKQYYEKITFVTMIMYV